MSAIDVRRTEINGVSYSLIPMYPEQAVEFAPRVLTTLISSMGEDLPTGIALLKEGDQQAIGALLLKAAGGVDPATFSALAKDAINHEVFVGDSEKLSDKSIFHKHFMEHPGNYLKLAVWAIWEHSKHFIIGSTGPSPAETNSPESTSQKSGNPTTSSEG